jgi:lysophospholipase L1-like esterase
MRVRLLALISVAAVFALGAVPAQADTGRGDGGEGQRYLALGDSVPFGFSPLKDPSDADNFVGYPEVVADRLDLRDVNATCPGEATGGFLSLTGTDNVCRPYRAGAPLHVQYTSSQMAFALQYLRAHKHSTQLVTLTLGANDYFRYLKDCAVSADFGTCPLGLNGVFGVMRANLDTIFTKIRATGYRGLIVGVTYYALSYSDPASVAGAQALNAQMIAAGAGHGVLIASGFDAWAPVATAAGGDSCIAGLLIRLTPTSCDVHPTPLGRDLLAQAVLNTVAASCGGDENGDCSGGHRD